MSATEETAQNTYDQDTEENEIESDHQGAECEVQDQESVILGRLTTQLAASCVGKIFREGKSRVAMRRQKRVLQVLR